MDPAAALILTENSLDLDHRSGLGESLLLDNGAYIFGVCSDLQRFHTCHMLGLLLGSGSSCRFYLKQRTNGYTCIPPSKPKKWKK